MLGGSIGRGLGSRALWAVLAAAGVGAAAPLLGSCIASGPPIDPITGDEDGGFDDEDADTPDGFVDVPETDPHAVQGANPAHGPFNGGQRVIISGNGYSSEARVWFGDVEAAEVLVIDASKLQVTAPPGTRGPVDLTTQNGEDDSTKRTLVGGYTYDALYADPQTGPVSGGTEVRIVGQGTAWDDETKATIDQKACLTQEVVSPTEIVCFAPKGTPGAKPVRVVDGDDAITVLDAYTYEDSSDGFKGGLSGEPLDGTLKVLAFNNITGDPLIGATVIAGTDIDTAIIGTADDTGVAILMDPSLDGPRTVTVAFKCHSPITFVDVPVDTVTVFLDPVLTPSCAEGFGTPPGIGGGSIKQGFVEGEVVFPSVNEFEKGPFLVPPPIGNEEQVAYVFGAASNPTQQFFLPSAANAITPADEGGLGYTFSFASSPGNRAYYALAGLENRTVSPPTFVAYSMGLVRGVPVASDEVTTEVYIDMRPLDLALTLDATPPAPGNPGPDRFVANVAVRLGPDGFALFPQGQKAPLLPLSMDPTFVGLPLLDQAFEGSTYWISARAVTGPAFVPPLSVVSSLQTNTTAFPVVIDGFVGKPSLETPAFNAGWDRQTLAASFGQGAPVDLTVYDVITGNGLMHWLVAVPSADATVELPDLSGIEGAFLPSGAIIVNIIGARYAAFDYGKLTYRQLRPVGMDAYAQDVVDAHIP